MARRDEDVPSGSPMTRAGRNRSSSEAGRVETGGSTRQERGGVRRKRLTQVGRFLLLKELGQGGMGVVYAAYDPDLDRKVALKLLLPGAAEGEEEQEQARTRLMREAQAMARVSHPQVIPVFEVGTFEEQVFVAMELVEGGTLRDWLREDKGHSWREVLEKFLAAGRGLAAAHAAGLVHRDFKPANVLLGRDGRVCVTDFGLARQVGEAEALGQVPPGDEEVTVPVSQPVSLLNASLTQSGVLMGTPNYMSPEQYRLEKLDARSDQFSFCAALYKALFQERPFDPAALRSASRAQSQSGQVLPVELVREPPRETKVPAWVRQAVMKGLALKPEERFASMEALLEALSQERRLAGRRRVVGLACAAGVALAVVGGALYRQSQVCAGAERLVADVWGPEARQRVEGAFQSTGAPQARELLGRVTQVLDGYADGWTRQHTEACEATRVRGVQTESLLSLRVVCLERRRLELQSLVKVLTEVDRTGVEKALDAAHSLPSPQDCADLEALSQQQPRPADPARRAELERLEGRLAEVRSLLELSRYAPALEQVLQLQPQVLATDYLPLVAELRFHHGWLQSLLGNKEEGARLMEQAVYDAEAGRADKLEVSILGKLVFAEGKRKRFEHAEQWGRLGAATLRRLGGEPVLEADLLLNRANLALMREQPEEARQLLERAQGLQAQALPSGHPKRARVSFTLGMTLLDLGELEPATQRLREALAQTEAAVGPLHLDVARRHHALSNVLRERKDFTGALGHARAAVDLQRRLVGPQHLDVAYALDELGMSLLALGQHEEALRVYQESLEMKRALVESEQDEDLLYSHDGVGQALLGLGRTREALEPLRRAVAFPEAPEDVLADSGFALARALWQEGQKAEARVEAARAQERFTQAGKAQRANEVGAWLQSLPEEKSKAAPKSSSPPKSKSKRKGKGAGQRS